MGSANVIARASRLPSSRMLARLRFVVGDVDELVSLARKADPPLVIGERAEIRKADRTVVLELRALSENAEWVEIPA